MEPYTPALVGSISLEHIVERRSTTKGVGNDERHYATEITVMVTTQAVVGLEQLSPFHSRPRILA